MEKVIILLISFFKHSIHTAFHKVKRVIKGYETSVNLITFYNPFDFDLNEIVSQSVAAIYNPPEGLTFYHSALYDK